MRRFFQPPIKPAPPPIPRPDAVPARKRRLRGLGTCRRGVVAVEFALASTPLIILVFGFIATSAVFNSMTTMQSNAQYAARMMSSGQISRNNAGAITLTNTSTSVACSSSLTSTQVEYYACSGLPSWTTFTVTSTENCNVPSVTVNISASASALAIADVLAIFSGKTIAQQAVLMKEGSCP